MCNSAACKHKLQQTRVGNGLNGSAMLDLRHRLRCKLMHYILYALCRKRKAYSASLRPSKVVASRATRVHAAGTSASAAIGSKRRGCVEGAGTGRAGRGGRAPRSPLTRAQLRGTFLLRAVLGPQLQWRLVASLLPFARLPLFPIPLTFSLL